MKRKHLRIEILLLLIAAAVARVALPAQQNAPGEPDSRLLLPEERKHLRNIRQLTFGGENAEAYFSADDTQLIFQAHEGAGRCDQIYTMDLEGNHKRLVSTGQGKTTCGYFFPDGKRILYSSTHAAGPACPPPPDYSRGYVWALYPQFDIYTARADGRELKPLTSTPGYDAEATISRDGKKIVYRAYHPETPAEIAEYKELLKTGLLRPTRFEIFVMDADGKNKRQVTHNAAANFAPFFHPDGQRITFASNMADPRGRNFDLYLIRMDGTGLERITYHPLFDAFPMFSADGKLLVWASNRNQRQRGETNIFLADWVE